MPTLSHQVALFVLLLFAAGCSAVRDEANPDAGWFGSDSTLHTINSQKLAGDKVQTPIRYAATLQVIRYTDQRDQGNPRLLGISTELIRGISGNQLL